MANKNCHIQKIVRVDEKTHKIGNFFYVCQCSPKNFSPERWLINIHDLMNIYDFLPLNLNFNSFLLHFITTLTEYLLYLNWSLITVKECASCEWNACCAVIRCHGYFCSRTLQKLGMKYKMADVCEKDTNRANFQLKTLFFKFSW